MDELNGILQGEESAIVKIGGRFLPFAERESFDRTLSGGNQTIDGLRLVESLESQLVHRIVCVIRSRMT